ncbi:hypothetical protein C9E81_05270 [Paracoccus alkanivorans]|uniref:Uncharacterized protein n=2 Tax=Paracoccus alkanivorans TaxID=2116655 RepID=A0A3M0MEK1_9RHOB|nr:hypothetical protein C9E81_05270 [Paracoccus alkanivorans]
MDMDPGRFPDVSFLPLGKGSAVPRKFYEHDAEAGIVRTIAPGWQNTEFTAGMQKSSSQRQLLVVSLPLNTSRILRDVSWHTHVPWQLRRSEAETPLSDQLVERLIDQDSRYAIGFMTALIAIGLDAVVLEAPRFFETASYLPRTRLEVCQYIDALYRERVRAGLAAAGVGVIDQPAETISDRGTTRLEYDHEDPRDTHHANALYGQLALDRILSYAAAGAEREHDLGSSLSHGLH